MILSLILMMKPAAPSQCFSAPSLPFQSSCTIVRRPHFFRALSCLVLYSLWLEPKTLNEKTGNSALILYKILYNAMSKPNQLIITSKARDQLQVRAHW